MTDSFNRAERRPALSTPRRTLLKSAVGAAGGLALPGSILAAGSTGVAPQPRRLMQAEQREVVMAQPEDVTTLDPNIFATGIAVQVVTHMFDTLVARDPETMEIVPNLAESWEMLDATTYVFHLKQGVLFHDGVELTANDVKFSIDRIMDPALGSTQTIYVEPFIELVEVVDPYTVRFTLKQPYAPWIRRVPTYHIVPEHYVTEVGHEVFAENPIGSGPYKFIEWVRDDHLTMEAFADYHKGAPPIKRVTIQPIPEASTRIAALLAGEVDILDQLPSDAVNTVEQSGTTHLEQIASNSLAYIAMNTFEPPLDDVRVRQALNYGIDWDTILTFVLSGFGVRAPIPATPNDFGYDEYADDLQQYTYNYDPERARQLLADAGYADGLTTTIETSEVATAQAVQVCQTIADQLSEIGVTLEVQVLAHSVFNDRWRNGEVKGMYINEVANPLFDPDHLMSVQWDPDRTSRYFNTPELTELIHQGMATTDEAARVDIYRQIMTMVLQAAPWLFAYNIVDLYGARNDIVWTPQADRRVFLFEASLAEE